MFFDLKKETRILLTSFGIGIFFAIGVAAATYVYSAAVQREIAESVIRFHVVAHDDSVREQALKEKVRTEILDNFAANLAENATLEQTRMAFEEIMPALQQHAEATVRRAGYSHSVTAEMATVFFPTQQYGNVVFPPGNFEAVQIIIGDGDGQNWWCLMFPPLCYVDMTTTYAGQALLAEAVSDESFRLLMHKECGSPEVLVRFRVVEWWQNRNSNENS